MVIPGQFRTGTSRVTYLQGHPRMSLVIRGQFRTGTSRVTYLQGHPSQDVPSHPRTVQDWDQQDYLPIWTSQDSLGLGLVGLPTYRDILGCLQSSQDSLGLGHWDQQSYILRGTIPGCPQPSQDSLGLGLVGLHTYINVQGPSQDVLSHPRTVQDWDQQDYILIETSQYIHGHLRTGTNRIIYLQRHPRISPVIPGQFRTGTNRIIYLQRHPRISLVILGQFRSGTSRITYIQGHPGWSSLVTLGLGPVGVIPGYSMYIVICSKSLC